MQASARPPDLGMVRDPHVIEAVGLEAIGLLAWLASQASPTPDLPGGWALNAGVRELTRALHMGHDKFLRLTAALQGAGLIHVETGMRFGRGGGSTPNRYWMTFDPNVPSPRGGRTVFTTPTDSGLSTGQVGGFQDRNPHSGNRHLTSVHEGAPSLPASGAGTSSISSLPVDDGSSSAVRRGVPKLPEFAATALREVGWQGAPPDVDPLLVTAVARHLKASGTWQNPAGQLNKLISQGKLEDYALLHGLVTSDPTGVLTEHVATAPSPVMMAYPRLCELMNEYPDWYAAVETEAKRLAHLGGQKMSMALIREVAAATPLPGDADGQARTS